MPGTFHRVSSNKAIFQLALKLIYFLRKNFPYYNRCLSTRVKKLILHGHYLKPNDLFCFSLYLAWRHLSGFCDFNSLWTFRNATVSVCCAFTEYKNVKKLKILIEFSVKNNSCLLGCSLCFYMVQFVALFGWGFISGPLSPITCLAQTLAALWDTPFFDI